MSEKKEELESSNNDKNNSKKIIEYKEMFTVFDRDDNGYITKDEFRTVLRILGKNPDEESLNDLIGKYDINKDGKINFEEFCIMLPELSEDLSITDIEEEVKEAFKVFDLNSDGFIYKRDLYDIMLKTGRRLKDDDIDAMFELVGCKEKIGLQLFVECITNRKF